MNQIRTWITSQPFFAAAAITIASLTIGIGAGFLAGYSGADDEAEIERLEGELAEARSDADDLEGEVLELQVDLENAQSSLAAVRDRDRPDPEPDPQPVSEPEPEPEPEPQPEPEPAPSFSEDDLEYKLAVIDEEATSPDDPVLSRYASALDGAKRICPDSSRQEISDQAVAAMQIVQDQGHDASAMDMLQGVGEVREARQLGLPCSEVFATMAALMTGG